MKISQILKRAFIVRKCILCGEVIDYDRKAPFCDECTSLWLANLDLMCIKCGFDCDYCTCLPDKVREINHSIASFGVFYSPELMTPVNRVVYKLKRNYNFEVIRFCAEVMKRKAIKFCAKLSINYRSFIVTFPPRRRDAVLEYGYDHAKLLAKEFAIKMGLELRECFKNVGKKEQKGLSRSDRLFNAINSFKVKDGIDVKGKSVFLVDDVMTSGATLNACAKMLIFEGAKQVIPITFAKDTKTNTSNLID